MKIESIRVGTSRLKSNYRNALVNFAELTASIVAMEVSSEDGKGSVTGYGFGSIGRYAQTEMIRDRFAARLLAAEPGQYNDSQGWIDPVKMVGLMRRNEKPGGHGERTAAIGAVDMAAWDLRAKLEGRPLYRTLAERFNKGAFNTEARVYAAGGYYYEADGAHRLREELEMYLQTGYDSVKIKIGGASIQEDIDRIGVAAEVVGSTDRVAVDANGRFEKSKALEWSKALEPQGVRWFEEPVDPLDFHGLSAVCGCYPHAIATGENLFSVQDVRNLLRYGGLRPGKDILQMDPGLSYGIAEFTEMLNALESFGWLRQSCFPHGGNLFNLHVAQGLQVGGTESYPGVFEPLGGFGNEVTIQNGMAVLSEAPGIGWETKPDIMDCFLQLTNN